MEAIVMVSDYQIISKPNCSLTPHGRLSLYLLLCIIPLLIGIAFTLLGLWLVLPFVGLELFALGYAFYYMHCHSYDYESITIDNGMLTVEKHQAKVTRKFQLNIYWAKVILNYTKSGNLSLYLRSHGKDLEIGKYMDNTQRIALAEQLKIRMPYSTMV